MLKKTKILIGTLSTIGLLGVTTAATVTPILLFHDKLSNTNELHNNNEWNNRPLIRESLILMLKMWNLKQTIHLLLKKRIY